MRLILRVLGVIYITYLSISILVLMPALNFLPGWYLKQNFDRDIDSEIILFNPFTLSMQLRNVSLPEHDGERFASLEKATVDLSVESLWQTGWVFDEISVHGLYAHIRQLADGGFNFSDMLPPAETAEPPATGEPTAIPALAIHTFVFQSHRLAFTNEAREEPYQTRFDDLDVQVSEFSTVLEEGRPYRIDATGEYGGSLHWEGVVSVPRARSEGQLRLSNLSLHAGWRVVKPWVNFELKHGRLNVQADYAVDWSEELAYWVSKGEVKVSGVDIQPSDTDALPDTAIALDEFSISGVEVDGPAQHLDVGTIAIAGLSVDGWMEDSQISLADLFATSFPESEDSATEEDSEDSSDETGWTVSLAAIQFQDGRMGWRSAFTDPQQLEISPITASVNNVHWPLRDMTDISLQLGINEDVRLQTEGSINLASGDGQLNYVLQGLPIPWANPNLPANLNAVLTDGFIHLDGAVELADFAPASITSNGEIADFAGSLVDTEESLTSLESLRWEALAVDLQERDVVLQQLTIKNYVGRLHIKKDGSINASNIVREEVGDKAEELAENLELDKPWSVSLPSIQIADSQIDFMDESLPIVFRTVIGDLHGEVTDISTAPGATTTVDLKGSVDGYAPVLLAGNAEPFSSPPALDLNLNFNGVDMALLTPYSGTYAGYAIERGLLNLDLKYKLKNDRLEGHNSVRIDQMKLGEKVDSEKAADLPLELAVALLTDANGVIDLQVPVSGNVDDPSFDIGSVVTGAIMNIITKAITAPFKLLASLVGSEEDLQRLNFANGSAQLDDAGQNKLRQLTGALEQRPGLNLVVTGRLNLEADRNRLQQLRLREQLIDGGLSEAEADDKGGAYEKAITARYETLGLPGTGTGGATVSLSQQYDAVVGSVKISDDDLMELAEARSVAVKTFMIQELQMAPDRAVIAQSPLEEEGHIFSGVELSAGG